MVESGRLPVNGRIRAIIEKLFGCIEKWSNQCDYRKMVESVRVPAKGRIRASIEKLFGCLPEMGPINVSTEKW